jgi:hypothetical protein
MEREEGRKKKKETEKGGERVLERRGERKRESFNTKFFLVILRRT